jgi:hypothetical protein
MMSGMAVSVTSDDTDTNLYPNFPALKAAEFQPFNVTVSGSGVWNTYFEGDDWVDDSSCRNKPINVMEEVLVAPGLESYCPWSARSWRYDAVPEGLWWNTKYKRQFKALKEWYEPMREKGHEIVQKYYKFHPFIVKRAQQVNPVDDDDSSSSTPCLGVHIRINNKDGKHRRKIKADGFGEYINAFERAGGRAVYLATDLRRAF